MVKNKLVISICGQKQEPIYRNDFFMIKNKFGHKSVYVTSEEHAFFI